jgi:hypothetical protein
MTQDGLSDLVDAVVDVHAHLHAMRMFGGTLQILLVIIWIKLLANGVETKSAGTKSVLFFEARGST